MNKSNSNHLKIVLTGDAGVGKSSLIEREVENVFPVANPTIGTNFKGQTAKAQLWDGMSNAFEKLESMNRRYYGDAHAIGLCFSLSDASSFDNLEKRVLIIRSVNKISQIFLIGCKGDLEAKVSQEKISQLAQKYDLRVFRTSAKTNFGVSEVFEQMAKESLHVRNQQTSYLYAPNGTSQVDQKRFCQFM